MNRSSCSLVVCDFHPRQRLCPSRRSPLPALADRKLRSRRTKHSIGFKLVTDETIRERFYDIYQDALARAHLGDLIPPSQRIRRPATNKHLFHNGAWKPAHAALLHFLQRRIARQPAIPCRTQAQSRATLLWPMPTPQTKMQPWRAMRQLHQARRHHIL